MTSPDKNQRRGPTPPARPRAAPIPRPEEGAAVHALPAVPRPTAPSAPPAQPPAPPSQPAAAPNAPRRPVGPARNRWRHVVILLSFLLGVVGPSLVIAGYLWTRAADQYASRVGFSVQREDPGSAMELLGGLGKFSGSSSSDTDILYEFLQSQKLVSDIDKQLDLHAIWTRPDNDPIFALAPDASLEDLVDYWNRMVKISYGAGSGLLEIEVRAFTAKDATNIAEALFAEGSDMINGLSAIAREDAIRYARDELDEAMERLKTARETVTRFRNENQLIDPTIDLQSQAGLLSNLQSQQAEALIRIDLLRETVRDDDPRLEQEKRKLAVIEKRIDAERAKLGYQGEARGGRAFADVVGEFERLVVDREFAEKAYTSALAAYDAARAEARRQSRYLAAYMQPTRAESAAYPQRLTLWLVTTLFIFLLWSVMVLVIYSLKDRR